MLMKRIAIAAAALAFAGNSMTSQASAADYDFMPAPSPLQQTWAGPYFGGHIGHGGAKFGGDVDVRREFEEDPPQLFKLRPSLSPDGLLGGVQAGYNWQYGMWVFGIEGDISFTDWEKNKVFVDSDLDDLGGPLDVRLVGKTTANVDFLVSARARLGMAFDSMLLYGTGGVAFADAQVQDRIMVGTDTFSRRKNFNDLGVVLGGGVGWMVIPQTFSLGLEGLYYVFNNKKTVSVHEFGIGEDVVAIRTKAELEDAWVARLRGDFHF